MIIKLHESKNANMHLFSGIPPECLPVLERCVAQKLLDSMPDQLTVNQYESGQGEGLHLCAYADLR